MARGIKLEPDGTIKIGSHRHRIPERFSDRQIHSFRTLLEPIPDTPSGPSLSSRQRRRQEDFLMRRALTVVIPGLPQKALKSLSQSGVRTIHSWIARNRPELVGEDASVAR